MNYGVIDDWMFEYNSNDVMCGYDNLDYLDMETLEWKENFLM